MERLAWKLKLVILWIFQIVNYFTVLYILFLESGAFLEETAPGNGNGVGDAILILIIFIMVWLSFVSKPKISRWPNIIFGIIFFLYKVVALTGYFGVLTAGLIINEIWGGVAAALIVWYGWKIPNQTKVEIT